MTGAPDLATLFPQPLPCVAIEVWGGADGWPCFRVYKAGPGYDVLRDYVERPDHQSAVATANEWAASLGCSVVDLSEGER